jgi:hypothetical protein
MQLVIVAMTVDDGMQAITMTNDMNGAVKIDGHLAVEYQPGEIVAQFGYFYGKGNIIAHNSGFSIASNVRQIDMPGCWKRLRQIIHCQMVEQMPTVIKEYFKTMAAPGQPG